MLGMPAPEPPPPEPGPDPRDQNDNDLEPEWTVALTDDQHEEMRTTEVVELYARGTIDHETFIWADGMEDWKRPWEIPLISAALSARRLRPPTAEELAVAEENMYARVPEGDDATIVASVRFGPNSSQRGSMPSGVWHEPGRRDGDDDAGVGFDNVTVSLDTREAMGMLRAAAGEPETEEAVEYDDPESEEELPTQVHDFEGFGEGVDGLLSGMDDPTGQSFQAESRPLSDFPTMMSEPLPNYDDEDQTTIHEPSVGYPAAPSPVTGGPDQSSRLDALIDSAARLAPEPAPVYTGAAPLTGPYPASPQALPSWIPDSKKSSGSLWWLWLLILLFLLVAAAGASFYFKQPPNLYGPGGMPKLPFHI